MQEKSTKTTVAIGSQFFDNVQRRLMDTPMRMIDQIVWSPMKRGR